MKKKTIIGTVTVIQLIMAVFISSWQYKSTQNEKMELLCQSSVKAAYEHFQSYKITREESDYIAGVAEFRSYMNAYLVINDGSDADYIWCNILYGDMTGNTEKVKQHIPALTEALGYLSEDYDHPNGFNLINVLNNELRYD